MSTTEVAQSPDEPSTTDQAKEKAQQAAGQAGIRESS
jgi:hypothetical protein